MKDTEKIVEKETEFMKKQDDAFEYIITDVVIEYRIDKRSEPRDKSVIKLNK